MPRSIVGAGLSLRMALLLSAAACTSHPLVAVDRTPEAENNQLFPVETTKKIDLLFVVDNSRSMEQEQASLGLNFPRFMQAIEAAGMPDLHIAVISTDMGAGGIAVDNCDGLGDAGRFQAAARCPLRAGEPPFLKVDAQGQKNFDGPLTDAFACIATLGINGCGYEHPLQSVRVALSSNNPDLTAFLRPDAHLGIILITDEDDCSGDFDSTLFAGTRPGQSQNLRCATAGHVCGGVPVSAMPITVPLSTCTAAVHAPDEASRRAGLMNIDVFVNHVKRLKAPGRRILVAGIYGSARDGNYRITGSELDLQPVCNVAGSGTAAPGIRLAAFIDAFGGDGSAHSICGADLRDAMMKIGQTVAAVAGDTCLANRPHDLDPTTPALEVDCAVAEQETGNPSAIARVIPPCSAGGPQPCWEVRDDGACAGSRARFLVNRAGPAPDGITVAARCSGDPTPAR